MEKQKLEIIDFSDEYKDSINELNYEWLEKFFVVEDCDKISLSNPREEIIDKGGYIYYAKLGNDIVGTVSLLKDNDDEFTLAKMAVKSNIQGYGIGTQLIEHVLNVAKKKDVKKLTLYSNTQLEPALKLYRKYGFKEIELEKGDFTRSNIKMEKIL